MRSHRPYSILLAASLTLSAGAFAQEQAQRNPGAGPHGAQTERQRIEADTAAATVSPAEQTAICQTLARIAQDATSTGQFDDLMKQFTSGPAPAAPTTQPANNLVGQPRPNTANVQVNPGGPGAETRASETAALTRAEFDSRIAQFQRDWKEKYHADFKLSANVRQVFTNGFAQINTSDLGEAARTASAKIGPAAAAPKTAQPKDNDDTRVDSRAVVLIEASHGAPMATLTLVKRQGGEWKLDTPQGVNEQRLRANVARHLEMVERDKANWPSDANDAYRLVAHHVFLAIDDAGAGMMQGGSVVQPGANNGADLGTPDKRAR